MLHSNSCHSNNFPGFFFFLILGRAYSDMIDACNSQERKKNNILEWNVLLLDKTNKIKIEVAVFFRDEIWRYLFTDWAVIFKTASYSRMLEVTNSDCQHGINSQNKLKMPYVDCWPEEFERKQCYWDTLFSQQGSKLAFPRVICHFLNTVFKTVHVFSFVCKRHRSGKSPFIPLALNAISNKVDRACNLFAASILLFLFLRATKEPYSNSCHFLFVKFTWSEPTFNSQIFCFELEGGWHLHE